MLQDSLDDRDGLRPVMLSCKCKRPYNLFHNERRDVVRWISRKHLLSALAVSANECPDTKQSCSRLASAVGLLVCNLLLQGSGRGRGTTELCLRPSPHAALMTLPGCQTLLLPVLCFILADSDVARTTSSDFDLIPASKVKFSAVDSSAVEVLSSDVLSSRLLGRQSINA